MKLDLNKYLQIGEIYREHGVKGYVKVYIYSATDENLEVGKSCVLQSQDGVLLKTKLKDVSSVGRYFLLKFDEFQNPEDVQSFRKAGLFVEKSKLTREEGEIYDYEWQGLRVLDTQKREIGTIKQIAYMPLKQFLVQTASQEELLIPYNPDWIANVDLKAKSVVLDLPEGLLDI